METTQVHKQLSTAIKFLSDPRSSINSLIVHGPRGGQGKSSGVVKALRESNSKVDYEIFKGRLTAASFFEFIEKHATASLNSELRKIIVLDDCTGILSSSIALNFLKVMTEKDGNGNSSKVSYSAKGGEIKSFSAENIGVIIITNNIDPKNSEWESTRDRAIFIEWDLSNPSLIKIMESMAESSEFFPSLSIDVKKEVLSFIKKFADSPLLSLRIFQKACNAKLILSKEEYEAFIRSMLGDNKTTKRNEYLLELQDKRGMKEEEKCLTYMQKFGCCRKSYWNHKKQLFGLLGKKAA